MLFVVWRITIGLSLIPAFATIYQRLTLPESPLHSAARRRCIDIPLNNTSAIMDPNVEPDEKMETEDVGIPCESPLCLTSYLFLLGAV